MWGGRTPQPRFPGSHPTPGLAGVTFAVTGSLSELQISYVCREVLQVRRGLGILGRGEEGSPHSSPQTLTVPLSTLLPRDWPICTHRRRYTETSRWSGVTGMLLGGGAQEMGVAFRGLRDQGSLSCGERVSAASHTPSHSQGANILINDAGEVRLGE